MSGSTPRATRCCAWSTRMRCWTPTRSCTSASRSWTTHGGGSPAVASSARRTGAGSVAGGCWTEIPSSLRVLGRQRRRWSRGLAELLWKHRRMIGNPRYGRVGLLGLPYYVVFEALAPVVELGGVLAVLLGLLFGYVDWTFG